MLSQQDYLFNYQQPQIPKWHVLSAQLKVLSEGWRGPKLEPSTWPKMAPPNIGVKQDSFDHCHKVICGIVFTYL